jgi:hypothetical protein
LLASNPFHIADAINPHDPTHSTEVSPPQINPSAQPLPKIPPKTQRKSTSRPNKPTPAVGPAIIEDNTTKPPTTMPAHIAVSSGYAATLHLWMFLYLLVQEEIIDGLVIGLEEGKRQGKNQAIS